MSYRLRLQIVVAASLAIFPVAAQQPRMTSPIDSTRSVELSHGVHPLARAEFDQGAADRNLKLGYITMVLKPTDTQQADLETLLAQQQDHTSPNYHRWLTPEQFGDRFGMASSDLAAIRTWLAAQGFHIEDTARGRNWIAFSATAEQVNRALHTEIHRYLVKGRLHYANATNPSLPPQIAGVVRYFRGLDDFEPEPPAAIWNAAPAPDFTSSSATHTLSPDDFATIYDITPIYGLQIHGEGQSVVVVGRTDIDIPGYQTFRSLYGLPATVPVLHLVGTDPGMGTSSDFGEAMLDVEWAGATARNATIIYVYSTSIYTDYQEAVDKNLAPVITSSYSSCEPDVADTIRYLAQQAAAQGITWLVVTNDSGAAACDDHHSGRQVTSAGYAISYPASIPEITAVGGTMFMEGSGTYWGSSNSPTGESALTYIPEVAWNQDSSSGFLSTGGGMSIFYPKPLWQTGPGVPNDGVRDIPDISMTSAGHDGYRVYENGLNYVDYGTSAATPAMAGVVALLNQYAVTNKLQSAPGMGNINPELYRLAQTFPAAFHDVTAGNNNVPCMQSSPGCVNGTLGYSAGPGYDLVTGIGSVDVNNLITHWGQNGDPSRTTVSANAATDPFNTKPQVTATVAAANGSGTPSGTVTFLIAGENLGATTLGSAPLTSGTASLTVDQNQLVAGLNTITAVYSGDSKFDVSSGTASVTVNLPTNAAAIVVSCSPNPVYSTSVSQNAPAWNYTLTLMNLSSVPATLTGFTIAGTDETSRLSTFFTSTSIPAHGTLSGSVSTTGLTPPVSRLYAFTGTDANGNSWNQQITVPFIAPLRIPELQVFGFPGTVQQNPGSATCPWMQRLYLQEVGGYNMQITKFLAGSTDMLSRVSQLFGTTEIAGFGALQATICTTGSAPAPSVSYQFMGTSDGGSTWQESLTASYAAAAVVPATLNTAQTSVALSVPSAAGSITGTIQVNLAGGTSSWTASIFPSTRATNWLTISPASGSGAGTITLTANAAGQSPGVYHATVIVVGTNSLPQFVEVPVNFTIGASPSISIAGVANAASGVTNFAPGMVMSVYGTGLANTTQLARAVPLSLSMGGVSATVNGVPAPLYYVSPNQINLQIPYETGAQPAVVGINNNGAVASFAFATTPTAPGIFAANGNLVPVSTVKAGGALVLFMTGEGDVNPELITGDSPAAGTAISALPAPRLPVTVTVGGITAPAFFTGIPPALVGVTQVNFTVPANVPVGIQPVVVTTNGVASAPVNITVN
jgi:uncharacterized protein (TIGR03437 family)